jgi:membrane peptidoglycan carboxypeptidase
VSANQGKRAAGARSGAKRGSTTRATTGSAGRVRLLDYPRAGKSGVRRWLPSWRLVLGLGLTSAFLVMGLVVAAYSTTTIPRPDTFSQAQTTTVRYANEANGKPGRIMGTFAEQKRQIIPAKSIPDHVGHAVVASEDSTFYQNSGVSPKGIARALVNNLKGGSTQGGSTITQQYVERYYKGKTTSDYVGKFKEALLAVKVGQSQDKNAVLANYLNTIYLGRSTYGIQAAAQAYFGKDAKDLSVSEGALIAGIIPSPSNWDPRVNPKMAKQRWTRVLDRMVGAGFLTEKERKVQKFPATIAVKKSNTYQGPQGFLLDMVRRELKKKADFSDDQINTVGLDVTTTIQFPVQDAAQKAVLALRRGQLSGGDKPNDLTRIGLTSIDPKDGAIISLYGGPDYLKASQNASTQDSAQAGSTFKPFALVAALESGVSLYDRFDGYSPQTPAGWDAGRSVKNFNNEQFGKIDLIDATAESVNTVYAQLNLQIGPKKTAETAVRAGVTTKVKQNPANVLGTDIVHPIDMADAYATFASGGNHSDPFIVRKATYVRNGSLAYQGSGNTQAVFKSDVIADATYAMTKVVERGSGEQWIKPLGRPIAGKTGTSSGNNSAWFVGFTPQISTAVALYQTTADGKGQDPISPFGGVDQVTGGTWPSALWANYMSRVFAIPKYQKVLDFPARANVNRKVETSTPDPTTDSTPTPSDTATANPATVVVPAGLAGMQQADAEAAILNAGLKPTHTTAVSATVPAGRVVSATPAGGTVPYGSTVSLLVSSGTGVPGPKGKPTPTPPPTALAPGLPTNPA